MFSIFPLIIDGYNNYLTPNRLSQRGKEVEAANGESY